MRSADVDSLEWSLYWTDRDAAVPSGFLPLLDEWADIDARERALDVERGTPILVDPLGRIDVRLARFVRHSRFGFLAEGTRVSYAKDYRLFFTFLWRRGRCWDQAEPEDIDDYEAWRRRSEDSPRRIGGSKWARELAAFKLLYEWSAGHGHMDRSPVLVHSVRRRDGTVAEVANHQPRDVRASNVKWLTPRTFRLWRDVGLRGYGAAGLPDETARGRNDGRNVAFADLLFDSGLRLREAGCLLVLEVPDALAGQSYFEGTVAAAIAKRRERMFYVSASALEGVAGYLGAGRSAAIGRAQREGRYERLRGKRTVTSVSSGRHRRVSWVDSLGRTGQAPVSALTEWERRRMFIEGKSGLEPLALWLGQDGTPMDYRSWGAVFDAANRRCGRLGVKIRCMPHMCRHSFALKMLVTLQYALDRRFGLTDAERDHLRRVYGDPFTMVRDLLGHRSEVTTRMIYLEPLTGLRLASILDSGEDLDGILARVAASSRQVLDIDPDEDE